MTPNFYAADRVTVAVVDRLCSDFAQVSFRHHHSQLPQSAELQTGLDLLPLTMCVTYGSHKPPVVIKIQTGYRNQYIHSHLPKDHCLARVAVRLD